MIKNNKKRSFIYGFLAKHIIDIISIIIILIIIGGIFSVLINYTEDYLEIQFMQQQVSEFAKLIKSLKNGETIETYLYIPNTLVSLFPNQYITDNYTTFEFKYNIKISKDTNSNNIHVYLLKRIKTRSKVIYAYNSVKKLYNILCLNASNNTYIFNSLHPTIHPLYNLYKNLTKNLYCTMLKMYLNKTYMSYYNKYIDFISSDDFCNYSKDYFCLNAKNNYEPKLIPDNFIFLLIPIYDEIKDYKIENREIKNIKIIQENKSINIVSSIYLIPYKKTKSIADIKYTLYSISPIYKISSNIYCAIKLYNPINISQYLYLKLYLHNLNLGNYYLFCNPKRNTIILKDENNKIIYPIQSNNILLLYTCNTLHSLNSNKCSINLFNRIFYKVPIKLYLQNNTLYITVSCCK